ncbi:MAG: tRNA (guanosine(46)-N7)-methyltransferase TrmB [Balneolaceae bacterium]
MPKIKKKRFAEMRTKENVFEWTDYNAENPFPKGAWNSEIFKNDNPIILELACGKGEYSVGLAQLRPHSNLVGVDIKGNRMWVGATEAQEKSLDNVRFLRAYIDHLDQFFGESEVDELWILFSDPYIKKARKRLTAPKFLALYRTFLKPGGIINLKTDSDLLYEYTKEIIEEQGLEILRDIPDVHKQCPDDAELAIKTFYEKTHLKKGKPSKFLSFRLI